MREQDSSDAEDEADAGDKGDPNKASKKAIPQRIKSKKVFYFKPDTFLTQDPEK